MTVDWEDKIRITRDRDQSEAITLSMRNFDDCKREVRTTRKASQPIDESWIGYDFNRSLRRSKVIPCQVYISATVNGDKHEKTNTSLQEWWQYALDNANETFKGVKVVDKTVLTIINIVTIKRGLSVRLRVVGKIKSHDALIFKRIIWIIDYEWTTKTIAVLVLCAINQF